MSRLNQDIIVQMSGRLGNQLFQYAFGRNAQIKSGGRLIINFYTVEEKNKNFPDQMWGDSLKYFNTNYEADLTPLNKFWKKYLNPVQYILLMLRGVLRSTVFKKSKFQTYDDLSRISKKIADLFRYNSLYIFPIRPAPYQIGKEKNAYCMAFFEDESLFSEIKPILVEELTPKFPILEQNSILDEKINDSEGVCVTIRRGDFLSEEYKEAFYICDENYFIKGVNIMKNKIKNPVFFFFSDDLDYAKEFASHVMSNSDEFYIETPDNPIWEKMRLMSSCKHFVISNSTFSWWCQYLSTNQNKVVIGPEKWSNSSDNNSIIQDEWIKI